ncbi:basic proline-rich protein-like [Pezoporus flaviventris]|uniref:basic proline-rich protein-like n=1 Tax=Pezoporus flaviventris TaxID=889875 RepID=UPI002AB134EF|nr:basic proline-rich protein-like [Pezoporus flaviventris]
MPESRSLSELTRQIAPPTKNGHAPPPTESRKSSQSVNPVRVRAGFSFATILPPEPKDLGFPGAARRVMGITPPDRQSASFMVGTTTDQPGSRHPRRAALARRSVQPAVPLAVSPRPADTRAAPPAGARAPATPDHLYRPPTTTTGGGRSFAAPTRGSGIAEVAPPRGGGRGSAPEAGPAAPARHRPRRPALPAPPRARSRDPLRSFPFGFPFSRGVATALSRLPRDGDTRPASLPRSPAPARDRPGPRGRPTARALLAAGTRGHTDRGQHRRLACFRTPEGSRGHAAVTQPGSVTSPWNLPPRRAESTKDATDTARHAPRRRHGRGSFSLGVWGEEGGGRHLGRHGKRAGKETAQPEHRTPPAARTRTGSADETGPPGALSDATRKASSIGRGKTGKERQDARKRPPTVGQNAGPETAGQPEPNPWGPYSGPGAQKDDESSREPLLIPSHPFECRPPPPVFFALTPREGRTSHLGKRRSLALLRRRATTRSHKTDRNDSSRAATQHQNLGSPKWRATDDGAPDKSVAAPRKRQCLKRGENHPSGGASYSPDTREVLSRYARGTLEVRVRYSALPLPAVAALGEPQPLGLSRYRRPLSRPVPSPGPAPLGAGRRTPPPPHAGAPCRAEQRGRGRSPPTPQPPGSRHPRAPDLSHLVDVLYRT